MSRNFALILLILGLIAAFSCSLLDLRPETSGNRYALIAGLEYSGNLKLTYTVSDAEDMEAALTSLGYQASRITVEGGDVTKKVILDAVSDLQAQVTGDDLVLFFFAGHSDIKDGTFFIEAEGNTRITREELLHAFALFSCPVVIIMDSCFSGGCIPEDPYSVDILYYRDSDKDFRDTLPGNAYSQAVEAFFRTPEESSGMHAHIWVFTAAGYHQKSFEPLPGSAGLDLYGNTVENGYFTHFLLMGLAQEGEFLRADANFDGVLTLSELYGFVLREFHVHRDQLVLLPLRRYLPHVSGSPRDVLLGYSHPL